MISVAEARKILSTNVSVLAPVSISLTHAAGLTLAEDVLASCDIPAFPQSSMDGYAIAFDNYQNGKLKVVGEVAAGSNNFQTLPPGTAARIFTGAAVPDGVDTVVMQEKIKTEGGMLVIVDDQLQRGFECATQGF